MGFVFVYDRAGTLVSNWPVSAYGKSSTASMSNTDALQRAAVLAMRDAAALMILKMNEQTKIGDLADSTVPVPSAEPPASDEDESPVTAAGEDDEAS